MITNMKKIFTLLFCIGAIALASHADTLKERCIDYLLNNQATTATINAAQPNELDANFDGVVNMDDLTTIINQELGHIQSSNAPAHQGEGAKLDSQTKKELKLQRISRTIKHPSSLADQKPKKEQ